MGNHIHRCGLVNIRKRPGQSAVADRGISPREAREQVARTGVAIDYNPSLLAHLAGRPSIARLCRCAIAADIFHENPVEKYPVPTDSSHAAQLQGRGRFQRQLCVQHFVRRRKVHGQQLALQHGEGVQRQEIQCAPRQGHGGRIGAAAHASVGSQRAGEGEQGEDHRRNG